MESFLARDTLETCNDHVNLFQTETAENGAFNECLSNLTSTLWSAEIYEQEKWAENKGTLKRTVESRTRLGLTIEHVMLGTVSKKVVETQRMWIDFFL